MSTQEGAQKGAKMDAEGAGDVAFKYIIRVFPGLKKSKFKLGLEEVVPCGEGKWRVTFGFTPPWCQGTNAPRIYKDVIIKDDGNATSNATRRGLWRLLFWRSSATSSATSSVISMTNRPICAPKSVCEAPAQDACTVVQSAQPGYAAPVPFGWGDIWRTLRRAFVGPIQSAMGLGSFIALIIEARSHNLTQLSFFVLFGIPIAVIIGLFAEGLRQQRQVPQRPNSKKCNCRPRNCRCRRLRRKRIESEGQASPS